MKSICKDKDKNSLIIIDEVEAGTYFAKSDFREKMVRNNHIKGLLEFNVNIVDHEKIYEYDTAGLVNLEYVSLHEELSCERIRTILLGIADIILDGTKYMLDEKDYIMDPAYIFFDGKTNPYLAYHTGYGQPFRKQLENLSEYLMNRIDYHDQKAVLMVYTVYMRSREEGFGVYELKEYVKSGGNNDAEQTMKTEEKRVSSEDMLSVFDREPFFDKTESFETGYGTESEDISNYYNASGISAGKKIKAEYGKYLKPAVMTVFSVILVFLAWKLGLLNTPEGKTDVLKTGAMVVLGLVLGWYICKKIPESKLNGKKEKDIRENSHKFDDAVNEATELLSESSGAYGSKLSGIVLTSDSYPDINVCSFPFYIGKDEAHMDYCLNATGVSRYHMKIDCIEDNIFISDLNSTNGTYLNGIRIESNRQVKIHKGDRIKIGLCEYMYR